MIVFLILYTKCIQKFVKLWYTFSIHFVYIHQLYSSCIIFEYKMYILFWCGHLHLSSNSTETIENAIKIVVQNNFCESDILQQTLETWRQNPCLVTGTPPVPTIKPILTLWGSLYNYKFSTCASTRAYWSDATTFKQNKQIFLSNLPRTGFNAEVRSYFSLS